MLIQNIEEISDAAIIYFDVHVDDRGSLSEIFRDSCPPISDNLFSVVQANITTTYPGVIKAFHAHGFQWDYWVCVAGRIKVVLYDRRPHLDTYKNHKVVYLGVDKPAGLLIPAGVLHGYKVLGNEPATLLYFTSEEYDPENPDEYRYPFDIEIDSVDGLIWDTVNR